MIKKDGRCYNCNSLMFQYSGESLEAEFICQQCRRINYTGRSDQTLGLRGKDFQAKSLEHKCSNCGRLLLRTIGEGKIEIKCRYCKVLTKYDTLNINKEKTKKQPSRTTFI